MPVPSLAARVAELHAEIDRVLVWSHHLPAASRWVAQLNELRFVRATLAWEEFLEQSFICYLRGARSVLGHAYPLTTPAASNVTAALSLAIGTAPYGKWLNERWTLARAAALFAGTHPYIALSSPSFPEIRAIRNRVVHRSETARQEFQRIVVSLHGAAKPGMTPGRLLSEHIGTSSRIDAYLTFLKTVGTLITN